MADYAISERLTPILRNVLRWDPNETSITLVESAFTNSVYLLSRKGRTIVLRLNEGETDFLGIDRQNEITNHSIAATQAIAPMVVDASGDWLITEHVDAKPVIPGSPETNQLLGTIARTLSRVHGGQAFSGSFCPFSMTRRLRERTERMGLELPQYWQSVWPYFERLELVVRPRHRTLGACHNDLHRGNILQGNGRIWLVDWEYSSQGDPFFDLGKLCARLSLDSEQREALLFYYSESVTKEQVELLFLMECIADFWDGIWHGAQAARDPRRLISADRTLKRFNDFVRKVRGSEVQRLIG